MDIEKNKLLIDYIENVCTHIKQREVHADIKLEILGHIEDLTSEYMEEGLSESDAIDRAIRDMGDSQIIGEQLNRIHRQSPDWGLVISVILFSGFGLGIIYSMHISGVFVGRGDYFLKSLIFNIIGIGAAIVLYCFDYRRMKHYSKYLYGGTIFILILTIFIGKNIAGRPALEVFGRYIDISTISPYLLAISLCGIVDNYNFSEFKFTIKSILLYAGPLLILIFYPSYTSALIYTIVFAAIMVSAGMRIRYILTPLFAFMLFIVYSAFQSPYGKMRLLVFLMPSMDPNGAGYLPTRLKEIVFTSGLLGNGFDFNRRLLPEMYTNTMAASVFYALGWLGGGILAALIIYFIFRLFKVFKGVKNSYGKLLIISSGTILSVQFVWSMLMLFGIVPVMDMSLPFMSYGGMQLILNMSLIGVVSSVHKRKSLDKSVLPSKV